MTFEMWLFAVKKLWQTYDMTLSVYNQLPDGEKTLLRMEYDRYIKEHPAL